MDLDLGNAFGEGTDIIELCNSLPDLDDCEDIAKMLPTVIPGASYGKGRPFSKSHDPGSSTMLESTFVPAPIKQEICGTPDSELSAPSSPERDSDLDDSPTWGPPSEFGVLKMPVAALTTKTTHSVLNKPAGKMPIKTMRDIEAKRLERLNKNKKAAQALRRRKKEYLQQADADLRRLKEQNTHLRQRVSALMTENGELRKENSFYSSLFKSRSNNSIRMPKSAVAKTALGVCAVMMVVALVYNAPAAGIQTDGAEFGVEEPQRRALSEVMEAMRAIDSNSVQLMRAADVPTDSDSASALALPCADAEAADMLAFLELDQNKDGSLSYHELFDGAGDNTDSGDTGKAAKIFANAAGMDLALSWAEFRPAARLLLRDGVWEPPCGMAAASVGGLDDFEEYLDFADEDGLTAHRSDRSNNGGAEYNLTLSVDRMDTPAARGVESLLDLLQRHMLDDEESGQQVLDWAALTQLGTFRSSEGEGRTYVFGSTALNANVATDTGEAADATWPATPHTVKEMKGMSARRPSSYPVQAQAMAVARAQQVLAELTGVERFFLKRILAYERAGTLDIEGLQQESLDWAALDASTGTYHEATYQRIHMDEEGKGNDTLHQGAELSLLLPSNGASAGLHVDELQCAVTSARRWTLPAVALPATV